MKPKTAWERISEDDEPKKPKDPLTADERKALAGIDSMTKTIEARPKKRMALYHDDDCGEFLTPDGLCPRCNFHPDMQSTAFREVD